MMVLQALETHSITLKNWPYLGPNHSISSITSQLLQSQSDCEICELLLLRCKCDRIFDSTEDSGLRFEAVIPLIIEENRAKFFTVSL